MCATVREAFCGIARQTGVVALLFLLSLSLRAGEPEPPEEAQPIRPAYPILEKTYPRVDGSTSTHPLAVLIACRRLGCEAAWSPLWRTPLFPHAGPALGWQMALVPVASIPPVDPGTGPDIEALREATRKATSIGMRQHSGTHRSILNVIRGISALALTARPPSEMERKMADDWHVELEAVPVALDAFVFLVHESNPVESLTTEQIRAIYEGKLKNWNEIGETDLAIRPYRRDEHSGSQQLMLTLVMQGRSIATDESLRPTDMMGVFHQMHYDKAGLAFSVYYFERFMTTDTNTKLIAVDGVHPTYKTIADRSYPYTTEVYAVTRTDLAADRPARRLRDWLRTPEGKAVIRESGYVPYAPSPDPHARRQQAKK